MAFTVPLTAPQFQNRVIVSGSFGGGTGPTGLGGAPRLLTGTGAAPSNTTDIHFALASAGGAAAGGAPTVTYQARGAHGHTGGDIAGFRPPAAGSPGQAVYLPFLQNNIASAAPPLAGVDCFFTDELSGCAIFIDRVVATGQVVAYHANAMGHCPKSAAIMANPQIVKSDSIHYAGAMNNMVRQHQAAMGDRAGGLGPMRAEAHLHRTTYMRCVDEEIDRLEAAGNTGVDVLGTGTNVMGFLVAGTWEFWYQTWAIITYKQPSGAPAPLAAPPGRILAAERFY